MLGTAEARESRVGGRGRDGTAYEQVALSRSHLDSHPLHQVYNNAYGDAHGDAHGDSHRRSFNAARRNTAQTTSHPARGRHDPLLPSHVPSLDRPSKPPRPSPNSHRPPIRLRQTTPAAQRHAADDEHAPPIRRPVPTGLDPA